MLGFVTPVYLTCLPQAVRTFLDRLDLTAEGDHYIWHVVTYGREPGGVSKQLAGVLAGKGISLQTAFRVRILSGYTPLFDVSDAGKVAQQVAAAEPRIDAVIEQIRAGTIDRKTVRIAPGSEMRMRMLQAGYEKLRRTRSFRVLDGCTGCGRCAAFCPDQVISLENGKPVWTSDQCSLCLGCLHRCPAFAIQYGDKTQSHGQYLHPGIQAETEP